MLRMHLHPLCEETAAELGLVTLVVSGLWL